MAIEIKVHAPQDVNAVRSAIIQNLLASRFSADFRIGKVKRKEAKTISGIITVHDVRLLQSKPYCGSHPAGCENPVVAGKKKPFGGGKTKYLEGSDWIAFNDLMNDALDSLSVAADIGSFVCEIRRGSQRRIRYDYHLDSRNQPEWDKSGESYDYADHCGKEPPVTEFPEDTPGSPGWRAEPVAAQ